MSENGDLGAVPLQKLVELDSAAHHLRDDLDRERVESASRNSTLREDMADLRRTVVSHGEKLAGIGAGVSSVKWMIVTIIPAAIGVAWTLGHLLK